jgi:peptide/nickel transport system substrate-binding protein
MRTLLAVVQAALLSLVGTAASATPSAPQTPTDQERLVTSAPPGVPGGRLVVALRAEPTTFNPVTADDDVSREIVTLLHADLVSINRETLKTELRLAREWTMSADGRRFTVKLRHGLRFSDGQPLTADDVAFTFGVHLDERNHSSQRDLLIVGGKPIVVRRIDDLTLIIELAEPYAVAERLFDGFPILPRHRLEKAQKDGRLAETWGLGTSPSELVGLGPFRLKEYRPGDRVILEPNPHYWKEDATGRPLPYLRELVFLFVASQDAQAVRFQSGETDMISSLGPENFALLDKEATRRGYRMIDLGPGLEWPFLVFNQNDDVKTKGLDEVARRQAWFRDVVFRRAVSLAIDRSGIARLVFQGRAAPLASHVPPGNKLWVNRDLRPTRRSVPDARSLLANARYSWGDDGLLRDPKGVVVEFSIITNAPNTTRVKMATLIQADLRELGMRVSVTTLESRATFDRILNTHDYDAAIMSFAGTDSDPNPGMSILLSNGPMHVWNMGQARPATPWEAEIDDLMHRQISEMRYEDRKKLVDRVQEIIAEQLPVVPLVSPHFLAGAKSRLGNLRPGILPSHLLWNADELYWTAAAAASR